MVRVLARKKDEKLEIRRSKLFIGQWQLNNDCETKIFVFLSSG